MLVDTERDSQPPKRSSLNVEKQTLRVSAVAALLAFCMGLAFSFGGKSSSIDSLRDDVNKLNNTVTTFKEASNQSGRETAVQIKGLEDQVKGLTEKIDNLQNQVQYQAQVQADYHSGGRR